MDFEDFIGWFSTVTVASLVFWVAIDWSQCNKHGGTYLQYHCEVREHFE